MKNICIVFLNVIFTCTCMAGMVIGKCEFQGQVPPRSMNIGSTTVYYYEMSSSSSLRGGVEYKQCTGDVWVIYKSKWDAEKLRFQTTNGYVQVCYDF